MEGSFHSPETHLRHRLLDVIRVLPRVYFFLWQETAALLSITCTLMTVAALVPTAIVWMIKVIVDGVVEISGGNGEWNSIRESAFIVFGLLVFQTVLQSASSTIQGVFSERVHFIAQQRIIEKAGSLDVAFFETPEFHDQLRYAHDQLHRIEGVTWSSVTLFRTTVGLTAMMGLLMILHPMAMLVLAATVAPSIAVQGYLAKRRFDFQTEFVRNSRMTAYLVRLLTSRDSVKEVRIFALSDLLVTRFHQFRETQLVALRRMLIDFLKVRSGFDLFSLVGVITVWCYAIYQAVQARITVGDLTLVFNAARQCQTLLTSLVSSAGSIYEDALFATRFFDVLELDPRAVEAALEPSPTVAISLPKTIEEGIRFCGVSFKYPGADSWVLQNVSFDIPAQSKLAIVGENGAGKSTLVKLLARLYDPTIGEIILDGRNLPAYELTDLRRKVAVIFQDFYRYDLSAADNVGFGQVDAIDDRARIKAAAEKGGAHEIIETLPSGYDTILGKTFDEGVDLSGGEWQQLALSRAFMSDASIVILDEPTAALDSIRESLFFQQISELAPKATIVFISHRFSTVRMADLIVVLDDGQLIEMGSHDALVVARGKYSKMFNTQAAQYR